MLSFAFGQVLAEASVKSEPSTAVVVFTGVSLVFAVLLILILILKVQGKIFTSIDKKKEKADKKASDNMPHPSAAIQPAAQQAPPFIEQGIPAEVVAAIAAAVATIEGGKYVLKSVQASKTVHTNRWGTAGLLSYTEPF